MTTIENCEGAPHTIKMEYCGGWGYKKKALAFQKDVETQAPNKFAFKLLEDKGQTGRFEVTIFRSKTDLDSLSNGMLWYSKKQTGKFPFADDYDDLL